MDIIICAGVACAQASIIKNSQYFGDHATSTTLVLSIFACQYFLLKIYRVFLYPRYFSPLRHIPGPTEGGHFLCGQAINLLKASTPTELHVKWMKQYPEAPFIRYLSFFNNEVLVCNSAAVCRDVLQTHCYSVPKSHFFRRLSRDLIGKGLLGMIGPVHKAHRKMLAAPFSFGNILRLYPLFQRKAQELSAEVGQAVDDDVARGTPVSVNFSDIFMRAFLDIIGVAVLGKELSELDTVTLDSGSQKQAASNEDCDPQHVESPFHKAYGEFFAPPSKVKQLLTFSNGFVPVRWLPLQANRDFLSAMKGLRATVTSLVKERIADVKLSFSNDKRQKNSSTDLLTFIIEESMPGGSAEGMPEDVLTDHLLQFVGAGHETSANTLSFCLMVMANYHKIQEKVRTEISELLSKSPDPSYNEIDNLPYLERFIKEVMRVYPAVTFLYQQTRKDLVIGGIKIPAGTSVELCFSSLQQNPLIWGDDAGVVDPDRWVGIPNNDERLNPFAYNVFSNGPRICIGKSFALLELKTTLLELVRNFKFESVVQQPTYANPSLVLAPNGLKIRIQRV